MIEIYEEPVDLSLYDGDDQVLSSKELLEYLASRKQAGVFLKTKLPTLNELIGGFSGGELTVISGQTANGKTLLAQTFTASFAESGHLSLWFTYEVPMLQFLRQFGDPLPHFFMPKLLKDKTLNWLYDRIKEARLKYGIESVFIDHLHFLADLMTSKNPSLEIGQVMRTLKRWALDLDIAIFIIAHTMKVRQDKELDAGDTRDSCLTEDQLLYLTSGSLVPVKLIEPGDKVVSFKNIKTLQEDVVTNIKETGIQRVFKLTTQTGRHIEATENHKFYALTYKKSSIFGGNQGTGIAGWTKLKDLTIGQKIATVKEYPDTIKDSTLSIDQAISLGWILGDGHINKKFYTEICLSSEEECIFLKSIIDRGWGSNCKYRKYKNKNAYNFYVSFNRKFNTLARFFRLYKYNPTGIDKHVFPEIFNCNNDTVAAYLLGLFQADGSINLAGENKGMAVITLHTISKRLAFEVKHLLLRLGIVGWVRKQSLKSSGFRTKNSHIYTVSMYGQSLSRFMEKIGFVCSKQVRAEKLLKNWHQKENDRDYDIFFEKIKSIEYIGDKKTYDISVRGHHASHRNNSFCCQDIITHNSFIEQEADNVFYVWRAKNIDNAAILKITKNRSNGVMGKKINLMKVGKYLVEQSFQDTEKIKVVKPIEVFEDVFGEY